MQIGYLCVCVYKERRVAISRLALSVVLISWGFASPTCTDLYHIVHKTSMSAQNYYGQ